MRAAFAVLMVVIVGQALAQSDVTGLQCEGNYSEFLSGLRDVPNKGGYVEIQKSSVKIVAVIGFEGTYKVHTANEASVFFMHPDDELIQGSINRFTGQLQIHQQSKKPRSGDFGGFDRMWEGTCTPAHRMF